MALFISIQLCERDLYYVLFVVSERMERKDEHTQPPTVVCKMEAQLECTVLHTHCVHVFACADLYAQSML